jgi:predicted DNA-binding protein (UPF0251 family)
MNYKHGLYLHPLYTVWNKIKQRCTNSKLKKYLRYGGRGITICDEWLMFKTFFDWAMSNGWEPGLQINRIINDSNYEPSNCNFVPNQENCQNTSRTKLSPKKVSQIRYLGMNGYTQVQIGRLVGISQPTISYVLSGKQWSNVKSNIGVRDDSIKEG